MDKLRMVVIAGLLIGVVVTEIGCSRTETKSGTPVLLEDAEPGYVKEEILVKFKQGTSKERIEEINRELGVVVIKVIGDQRIYHLKIPKDYPVPRMIKKYKKLPEIEYAQPNYRYRISPGSLSK